MKSFATNILDFVLGFVTECVSVLWIQMNLYEGYTFIHILQLHLLI